MGKEILDGKLAQPGDQVRFGKKMLVKSSFTHPLTRQPDPLEVSFAQEIAVYQPSCCDCIGPVSLQAGQISSLFGGSLEHLLEDVFQNLALQKIAMQPIKGKIASLLVNLAKIANGAAHSYQR